MWKLGRRKSKKDFNVRNCPICDNSNMDYIDKDMNHMDFIKCSRCSLYYSPWVIKNNHEFYDSYNSKREKDDKLSKQRDKMYELDLHFMNYHINLESVRSVLDIGCGMGHFLNYFPKHVKCVGMDVDNDAVKKAGVKYPEIDFHNDLSDVDNHAFDCIIFRGSFQYIHEYNNLLIWCYTHLRDGGYVVILSLPNIQSPMYKLLGKEWCLFDDVEHINMFSNEILLRLMESHKFKHVYTEYPYMNTPYENVEKDSDNFINLCKGKYKGQIPFWGSLMNCVFMK